MALEIHMKHTHTYCQTTHQASKMAYRGCAVHTKGANARPKATPGRPLAVRHARAHVRASAYYKPTSKSADMRPTSTIDVSFFISLVYTGTQIYTRVHGEATPGRHTQWSFCIANHNAPCAGLHKGARVCASAPHRANVVEGQAQGRGRGEIHIVARPGQVHALTSKLLRRKLKNSSPLHRSSHPTSTE